MQFLKSVCLALAKMTLIMEFLALFTATSGLPELQHNGQALQQQLHSHAKRI